MLASLDRRDHYRRALGVSEQQRLVVVSSTWGRGSLLGQRDDLVGRLLAELPADEYRVAAALHPNIWHGHGPWQVETWLAACLRSGLLLLPPKEGWRAALVAADCVVGDHGSVTFYGAALGRPVLLASFPFTDVDPASPVAGLGHAAPFLDADRPLLEQLEKVIDEHSPARYSAITEATTSHEGESARLLRTVMYQQMALPEPAAAAVVPVIPLPIVRGQLKSNVSTSYLVNITVISPGRNEQPELTVVRLPAELSEPMPECHLAVDEAIPDPRIMELADVITCRHENLIGNPEKWIARIFERYPGCLVAGVETGPDSCLVGLRSAACVHLYETRLTDPEAMSFDLALHASVVHHAADHLLRRTDGSAPPTLFDIRVGRTVHTVEIAFRKGRHD